MSADMRDAAPLVVVYRSSEEFVVSTLDLLHARGIPAVPLDHPERQFVRKRVFSPGVRIGVPAAFAEHARLVLAQRDASDAHRVRGIVPEVRRLFALAALAGVAGGIVARLRGGDLERVSGVALSAAVLTLFGVGAWQRFRERRARTARRGSP